MADVTVLDKFTWQFQILGLQFFSIKNLHEDSKIKKFPSLCRCFLMIFWIILVTVLIYIAHEKSNILATKNLLSLVVRFTNYIAGIIAMYYCLFSSFMQHSKLETFFLKSKQISKLFSDEFNHQSDFREMRKSLIIFTLINLSYSINISYQYTKTAFENFDDLVLILHSIFHSINEVFLTFFIFRFYFYVSIVVFHLKEMKILMCKSFNDDFEISNGKIIKVWTVNSQKLTHRNDEKNILVLRKVYYLIKEMADIVNDTMGFLVLLQMLMFISTVILYGFVILQRTRKMLTIMTFGLCKYSCKL